MMETRSIPMHAPMRARMPNVAMALFKIKQRNAMIAIRMTMMPAQKLVKTQRVEMVWYVRVLRTVTMAIRMTIMPVAIPAFPVPPVT